MVRPLRIAVVDGWYHVYGRGIGRREIFSDERDRRHWLELLGQLPERYRVRLHAYCLMDNHYHALLQTPEANVSRALQWLHGSYSAWYNARHQRVGPLFQGRFRSVPIEDGAWAYRVSFYVHLNPLRVAGLGLDKRGRIEEGQGWREAGRAAGGMDIWAVSKAIRRHEQQAAHDSSLRERQSRLLELSNVQP